MTLALVAVWCFLVALGGGLVGLVLGNMRLPVIVLLASTPAVGAGTNIAISAVAATAAAVVHVRAGRVDWRLVGWMAPPSMVAAVVGGYVSGALPATVLLLVIAVVLAFSSVQLLRAPARPPRPARPEPSEPLALGASARGGVATAAPARQRSDVPAAIVTGAVVGFLGGVIGLILGSLRMPALLRFVGMTPQKAVGTNLTVGVLVGIAGTLGHVPEAPPDLGLLAIGAVTSIPGALLGARLTGRLSEAQLIKAIGAILMVAAASMVVQALT